MSSKKLKKVLEAERLCEKPSIEELKNQAIDNEYRENVEKAIKIYKGMCTSTLSADDKIEVLVSFLKNVPIEGREMLIKWRDSVPFLGGKSKEDLIKLLVLIAQHQGIDSHERSITAAALYNHVYLDVCFKCFESIASDRSVLIDYRVDACRYLFGSELEQHQEYSQECLIEIIEDQSLPSTYRYRVISGFVSKFGVVTYVNQKKIKIPYNEDFVYGLQSTFFYCLENGVRERILSGQHLLQMECVDLSEKIKIGEILLEVASTPSFDDNTRADAADVILRLGTKEQTIQAREIIVNLGFSAVGAKNKNIMNKVQTIYNNSQNIHDENISESVAKFIGKMIRGSEVKIRPYHEIHQEVSDVVRSKNIEKSQKLAAYNALNRISIDTATFTDNKVTLAEVFIHVWLRIQLYNGDIKQTLEDRLVEELTEMGDTCSTGHSGRFVNVLSAVDADLRISFESQIIANVSGRINARVRAITNADLRASVSMGMMPDADEEDRENYKKFIETALTSLREELYQEFVGAKYVSDKEFEKYFAKAKEQWMNLLILA